MGDGRDWYDWHLPYADAGSPLARRLLLHLKPLSDALDWLAGDPDQVEAYAGTWSNVAAALRSTAADLDAAVATDLAAWSGGAATAYRAHAGRQREALATMAAGADALALVTTGTGLVVALVRELVRDLIADFVSVLAVRLWEWLAIAGGTLGAGTPWVVAQVSTLAARWAAKIARLLTGLVGSLRRVAPMLRRLDGVLGRLEEELRRLARHDPTTPPTTTSAPAPARRPAPAHRWSPDPNRLPRGDRTSPARPGKLQDRGRVRENESADALSQHGYDVLQNPPPRANGKNPDYLVEGEYFDCYSPATPNVDEVRSKINRKVASGQADRIVLNLDDTTVGTAELRRLLERRPVPDLKEIKVIQGGVVHDFYPFDGGV
ncbi:hypothetical protein [Micromonospora sp. NPDC048830]|uniref:CdiA C-terminal domain-containing protein n=1 Tax=Micromonospora sp. NPDC048830 TaxID=3364257 RepID=UPI003716BA9D